MEHMQQDPGALHAGLEMIAAVMRDYAYTCLEAGAAGIFFATQLATTDLLTAAEYREFGVAYDLKVLEPLSKRGLTMLHVCGEHLMLDMVADYPADVIHWADCESGPSLAEGRRMTSRAIAGGLALQTLLNGTPQEVQIEVHDALAQAGTGRFVLAPACVIDGHSPDANLHAVRAALETA